MSTEEEHSEAAQAVYEAVNKKTVYSSFDRSASALEELAENTKALTVEMRNASESSTKLTKSLNWLTFAAVMIAGVALILETVKLYIQN